MKVQNASRAKMVIQRVCIMHISARPTPKHTLNATITESRSDNITRGAGAYNAFSHDG